MRSRIIVFLLVAGPLAHAQPVEPAVPPAPPDPTTVVPPSPEVEQPPPAPPPPPPAMARDGDAHNYERAPEAASVRGGSIVRGVGVGLGVVFRVVFAPFRGLLYLDARYALVSKIKNVFVNDAGTLGIYPALSYATDFGVTYGAKAFLKDYFGAGEEASLSAKTGGAVTQQYQFKFELPHIGGSPLYVRTRVRYEENSNLLFAGIGNEMATHTRFSQQRFLTVLSTGVVLGNQGTRFRIGTSAIYNDRSFGAGAEAASDPSIETVYDTSMLRGFDDGFRNLELAVDAELDTRDVAGPTHNGAVLRAFAGGGSILEDAKYAHYGGEAAYFLSPFWPGRVFVGRVALEGVRDRNNDIPFTELPRIGGAGQLRGYRTDQFRDKLATVATIEYHYPIHANISGDVFVETGKVAATYEALLGSGLSDNWHVGYGGGFIIHSKSAVKARVDVAFGDGLHVYFSTDVLDAFRKRETEL
ncbi:MAG: BamA/TamA family outer membrane protein [Kofleriaceae bacterium]